MSLGTTYPALPRSVEDVPDALAGAWVRARSHATVVRWIGSGAWPLLQLTTGPERGACGDPCTEFEWYAGDYPGIDGAVLVCKHGLPAPGWAYELDWPCGPVVEVPATPPCTCRYERAAVVPHAGASTRSLAGECYCAAMVFRINPRCLHHGDGFRW